MDDFLNSIMKCWISIDNSIITHIYVSNHGFRKSVSFYLLEKNLNEESRILNGNGIPAKSYINTEKGNNLSEDINKLFNIF